jgi:inosose dehydratase
MPTRRTFIQSAGAAATAVLASRFASAEEQAKELAVEKSPHGRQLELGMASYSLRAFPLDKCVAMTKRLGLKHLCLKDVHLPFNLSPEELAATAAKVRAEGLDLYACGGVQMHSPEEVDRAFDYAKAAGLRVIVAAPKTDLVPLLDEKVRKYDIAVAIHNHGPEDKYFPTPESAYKAVQRMDRRVGLCIDIGHTVRAGADPTRDAERFADRLLDVHIKDVDAAKATGQTVIAGHGIIDLPAFLRALKRTKYAGVVSFEYEKDAGDPLPGLAESVGYVRGVMAVI